MIQRALCYLEERAGAALLKVLHPLALERQEHGSERIRGDEGTGATQARATCPERESTVDAHAGTAHALDKLTTAHLQPPVDVLRVHDRFAAGPVTRSQFMPGFPWRCWQPDAGS